MNSAQKKVIVNIVCLGHSGSTLLGNILGSHSQGIHIGELIAPIKKGRPIICRNCFDDTCPIWGTVLKKKFILNVYNSFKRSTSSNLLGKIFGRNHSGAIYKRLFESFPTKHFVIDSSKNVDWYKYNSNSCGYTYKNIFLYRDIKAIYASHKRSRNKTVSESISTMFRGLLNIKMFYDSLDHENRLIVNYEDLVDNSKFELDRICNFLAISFEPNFYKFNEFEHHLIGGNQGLIIQHDVTKLEKLNNLLNLDVSDSAIPYYSQLNGIQNDTRWMHELTDFEKLKIDDNVSSSSHLFPTSNYE